MSSRSENILLKILNEDYNFDAAGSRIETLLIALGEKIQGKIIERCTRITLDKTSISITDNMSVTLTATVTPYNTTDVIFWMSSDESIATVSDGVVTPLNTGSCTITAVCGLHSVTCSVSVIMMNIPCTSIEFKTSSITMTDSTPYKLKFTVEPSNTTDDITFEVDDDRIVTVDNDGVITPVSNGTCYVTVTCGAYIDMCSVTVDI